jgi:hypothetical protein
MGYAVAAGRDIVIFASGMINLPEQPPSTLIIGGIFLLN